MPERTRTRKAKGMPFDSGSRIEERFNGSIWYVDYKSQPSMFTADCGSDTITDLREYGDNHPMVVKKLKVTQFLSLNMDKAPLGPAYVSSRRVTVKNYRHFNFHDEVGGSMLSESQFLAPVISQPSDSVLVTKLLAKTNPSLPVVSIPNFGHELRELPELVRIQGRHFIEKAASTNMILAFGLTPLIGDLLKLRDFTQEADKLFKQLNAVRKRGLRRTRTLWEGSNSMVNEDQRVVEDFLLPVYARRERFRKRTIKGHVRYVPTKDFPTSDDELRRRINQVITGMSTDSANLAMIAWNAMPWTWLIDWFANTGDLMARDVNILGLKPTGIRIMENDVCTQKLLPTPHNEGWISDAWKYCTPHLSTFEQKRRRLPTNLGSIPVEIKLPLFNTRQLGILASLFVLRSGRYPNPETYLPKSLRDFRNYEADPGY